MYREMHHYSSRGLTILDQCPDRTAYINHVVLGRVSLPNSKVGWTCILPCDHESLTLTDYADADVGFGIGIFRVNKVS